MERMIQWLVIGVGDITQRRVIPAILAEPRSKLVGVVTRDPKKAEAHEVPGWSSLADALEHSGADAVYIATPVYLHASQTIACLSSGRHVLCEKPMALNYAEACSMQRAAEETGRILGVAYYRRNYPKLDKTRELLESGAIGRPVLAEATCHNWCDFSNGNRSWLSEPWSAGGGPLFDIASHRIDLMNYLFGRPVRVTAQLSRLIQQVHVEDNATVLIQYENGLRGVLDARWHSKVDRDEFRICGTNGEIDLTPLNGPTLVHPGGEEQIPPHANLHYPCIANFVGAVLDRAILRSTGSSALWTDWVTEQAIKSARS